MGIANFGAPVLSMYVRKREKAAKIVVYRSLDMFWLCYDSFLAISGNVVDKPLAPSLSDLGGCCTPKLDASNIAIKIERVKYIILMMGTSSLEIISGDGHLPIA